LSTTVNVNFNGGKFMTSKIEQSEIISRNIIKLRSGLGWNQAKLAQEAGISGAALSKIEKGEGRVPTIVVLRKLANSLTVDVTEITGEIITRRSDSEERNLEFYRKFSVISELSKSDQEILLGMAERLKEMTKK
jgi:XRE family transcriptional regulator, regulator of sulfur utilization